MKIPPRKRRQPKKEEVPNYGLDIEDEVDDMNLGDLFDQPVLPEQDKQIVPKPPNYEESLKDVLEGEKEIYVDSQYLPPEYDEDDVPDYEMTDEDTVEAILDDISVANYDNVEKILNQPEMTPQKIKHFLIK